MQPGDVTPRPDTAHARIEGLLQHRAWLRALAARLVGADRADDLVQETWLAAMRRPPDPDRPARPWLAAVARRLAVRLKRGVTGRVGGEVPDPAPPTDELLANLELESELASEVAKLAEPYRRTVLLRYHKGLSAAQIARREEVPAGTVRWRLKRGLDQLRQQLDRRFGDRGSWALALMRLVHSGAAVGAAGVGGWTKAGALAAAAVLLLATGWGAVRGGLLRPRDGEPAGQERPALVAPAEDVVAEARRGEAATAPEAGAREALVQPDAPTPPLRLRVVESDGHPCAGRMVVLRALGEDPRVTTTDDEGRASFDQPPELATVVVDRDGGQAVAVKLAPQLKEHLLRLQRGEVLGGTVRVDGRPPDPPLELEIYRSDTKRDITFNPDARHYQLLSGRMPITTRTRADGTFAFSGLDARWSGTLRLPEGVAPAGPDSSASPLNPELIFLRAPTQDLVLDLVSFPSLTGRVLASDGVTPQGRATVQARVTAADGKDQYLRAETDAEGRYRLHLAQPDWTAVELEAHVAWLGRVTRSLKAAEVDGGDLGDIVLGESRSVRLTVEDRQGRPLQGARVPSAEAISGADGRLELSAPDQGTLQVTCEGYLPQDVELTAAEDYRVALETATQLVVRVVDETGRPISRLFLDLSGPRPLFDGESGMTPPSTREGPGFLSSARRLEDRIVASFTTDEHGHLIVDGVKPGQAIELYARSFCRQAEVRIEIPALAAEERREVRVELPVLHRAIFRVTDEVGRPVANADVLLRATDPGGEAGAGGSGATTDIQGEACLVHLVRGTFTLEVAETRHLPFRLEVFELPEDPDEVIEIRLTRGLDLRVDVRDASGRPVRGGRILLEFDPTKAERYFEQDPGTFWLLGLPDRRFELRLECAGGVFLLDHDARDPVATFTIPTPGTLHARWVAPPAVEGAGPLRLALVPLDPPGDGIDERLEVTRSVSRRTEWTFGPVLPGRYRVELRRGRAPDHRVLALSEVHVPPDGRVEVELQAVVDD